ncbi:MAG: helix-hairpin-helix domain-containing protein [Candidatus Omnitrophica bacterium]|jgi:competence protein ComEA|nr:helix-hairpin-helix domain-containing protein [Candidatus Omnitrophota bacterium]
MPFLTVQERKTLLFIAILILIGSLLRLFNPGLLPLNYQSNAAKEAAGIKSQPEMMVNINLASCDQLEKIPGIGSVIAQRIIVYRQQFGPLKSLEDLREVKGIGDKKLENIKQYLKF